MFAWEDAFRKRIGICRSKIHRTDPEAHDRELERDLARLASMGWPSRTLGKVSLSEAEEEVKPSSDLESSSNSSWSTKWNTHESPKSLCYSRVKGSLEITPQQQGVPGEVARGADDLGQNVGSQPYKSHV